MRPDLPIQIIVCIAIGIEFKLLVSEVDFVSHICCSHKITTLILDSRCHYSQCHTTVTELSLINMKEIQKHNYNNNV